MDLKFYCEKIYVALKIDFIFRKQGTNPIFLLLKMIENRPLRETFLF
jgi:hypothetical protein